MALVNVRAGGKESVRIKIFVSVCRKTYSAHLYTSAWYWNLKLVSPLTLPHLDDGYELLPTTICEPIKGNYFSRGREEASRTQEQCHFPPSSTSDTQQILFEAITTPTNSRKNPTRHSNTELYIHIKSMKTFPTRDPSLVYPAVTLAARSITKSAYLR